MKKYIISTFIFILSNHTFASGWGGDEPKYSAKYSCSDSANHISLELQGTTNDPAFIDMSTVQIFINNYKIEFNTNFLQATQWRDLFLNKTPNSIYNSVFQLSSHQISGFAVYSDSKIQLGVFIKSPLQVEVTIYDLEQAESRKVYSLTCKLSIETL